MAFREQWPAILEVDVLVRLCKVLLRYVNKEEDSNPSKSDRFFVIRRPHTVSGFTNAFKYQIHYRFGFTGVIHHADAKMGSSTNDLVVQSPVASSTRKSGAEARTWLEAVRQAVLLDSRRPDPLYESIELDFAPEFDETARKIYYTLWMGSIVEVELWRLLQATLPLISEQWTHSDVIARPAPEWQKLMSRIS